MFPGPHQYEEFDVSIKGLPSKKATYCMVSRLGAPPVLARYAIIKCVFVIFCLAIDLLYHTKHCLHKKKISVHRAIPSLYDILRM
jgi:hypothetical protein